MNSEWPEDPSDPRCPECDGPVSATAAYCMHCEADLPAENFGAAEATTASTTAEPSMEEMTEADPGMPTADEPGRREPTLDEPADTEGALLDSDSLLDDVSTVVVGAVGGLLTAILGGLVVFWLLPRGFGSVAFWLGVAGGAGGGLWMARTRTVFGAARKAGYTVGGLLALVPLALAVALDWQTVGDAVGGMVVFGVFLWPVALVVVGLGWLLGKGGVDDEG